MAVCLHEYLTEAAIHWPDKIAIQEIDGSSISYRELDHLSDRLRDRLAGLGVGSGDRVGFWIRKSIDAVATLFGILKAGAAYVPVDPAAPLARNGYILADCEVAAVIVESRFETLLRAELSAQEADPAVLVINGAGGGTYLRGMLDEADCGTMKESATRTQIQPKDLAFVLYTSGSTGRPKGVLLTHLNAQSFVEWCAETFALLQTDRFSSHAPFHFDLSVFDIFSSIKHGGTLILIGEEAGKRPLQLAELIARMEISVWYSAPSILSLMAQYGELERRNYSSLRIVLFAGEVFPLAHLKTLTKAWPHPSYFNLYGPTETNVCTSYEVPLPIPEDRTTPMPIGKVCSHLVGVVIDPDGSVIRAGAEGELCIRGPGVTQGYWNLPEQSKRAFVDVAGARYYRTGDIVKEDHDGNLRYLGRKDRMIKKRGFRVELGEIEVCLYRHPQIREAAVVALADDELGMKVHAHLVCNGGEKPSLIEMKAFCSEHIPVYMIPDRFSFHHSLPKTSTDKIDYQTLKVWS